MNKSKFISVIMCVAILCGCGAKKADAMGGNVYSSSDLNKQQSVKTIDIIEILPAKIALKDGGNYIESKTVGTILGATVGAITGYALGGGSSNKGAALGGIIGAALGNVSGGIVGDSDTIVDGVTIIYKVNDEIFTSTQAGKVCEFKSGSAYLISTNDYDTRIQPNTKCENK